MKIFLLTAVLSLTLGSAAQAKEIEIVSNTRVAHAAPSHMQPAQLRLAYRDLALPAPGGLLVPTANMSELPEPEVFLMMLLGLCLIGYRASRVSTEKFEDEKLES